MQVVLDHFGERPTLLGARIALMLGGVLLNGVATGMYIGARLGPGPRDGLMTGLAARGHSVRVVRTGIEVGRAGCRASLLGGTVGIGTVIYALGIGPLVHITLPLFESASSARTSGATCVPNASMERSTSACLTAPTLICPM